MSTELVKSNGGSAVIHREEFGANQMQVIAEKSATAIAAREKAMTEARFIVAMRRPRAIEEVRLRMLKECDRPGFAEVARYRKPVGRKRTEQGKWEQQHAEGFSIRFAEMAIRHMGNLQCDALPLYDDEEQRIVLLSVVDLEANSSYSKPITLAKTVERKQLKDGQVSISERLNSYGEKVYLVQATDDDVNMKEASAWSKFVRNALRFVPGDILDECEARIKNTLAHADRENPDAARRKIIDAFDHIGVSPSDLQTYLGHSLERIQPAELTDLRAVYAAIKEGETTWDQVIDAKQPAGSVEAAQAVAAEKIKRMEREFAEQKQRAAQSTFDSPAASEGAKPDAEVVYVGESQQQDLLALAGEYSISQKELQSIIEAAGCAKIHQITPDGFRWICAEVRRFGESKDSATVDQCQSQPAKKMKFGEKREGK